MTALSPARSNDCTVACALPVVLQSTAGVNNCGDYLGVGRGGANSPMSTPPEHHGVTRYMAVPAGGHRRAFI